MLNRRHFLTVAPAAVLGAVHSSTSLHAQSRSLAITERTVALTGAAVPIFFRCAAPLWLCHCINSGIMPSIPPLLLVFAVAKMLRKQACVQAVRRHHFRCRDEHAVSA